ncbi:MAG: SLC13 family permease [Parvibaculales bacterium]
MEFSLTQATSVQNWLMWGTYAIIAVAMVSYALERIALEVTSLFVLIGLLVMFHIPTWINPQTPAVIGPVELLAGFGNPALIAVIALLVMGQGLFQSGAIEGETERFLSLTANHQFFALTLLFMLAMVASAFLNNTPVVLMCIPILTALAGRARLAPPSVMMPLSFICILGGMTTLIGSSTNLLVAGAVAESGLMKIEFFTITVPGLLLAVTGAVYVLFVMPYLLKNIDAAETDDTRDQSGKQYIVEFRLRGGDSLVGATPVAGFFTEISGMTLRSVERRGQTILPPFEEFALEAGDTLVMAATRRQLTEALSTPGHPMSDLATSMTTQDTESSGETPTLAEVVIAPGSRMQSRTIYQTGFRFETGCRVLGVQRRSRMLRQNLRDIRLEAGDVLLVLGTSKQVESLRSNRDVLLLEWSAANLPNFAHATQARVIFGVTILLAALNILPIVTAAVAGAAVMIISGVLNIRQAARGVDMRIFLTIGAALAMSTAMAQTGGAMYLATSFINLLDGFNPWVILSAFFLLCAVTTNILSNNATAVLFTPIALNLSQSLSMPVEAFIFAVIFAANCSFATPIAYQTNLLVMTPGNYQFKDFVKCGLPLLIIIWLTYSVFAPWYFAT